MITGAGMAETDAAALMSVPKTQQSVRGNEAGVPIKGFSLFLYGHHLFSKKYQKNIGTVRTVDG